MSRRSMGELEARVMDVLWDQGGWRTPGEVHDHLRAEGPIAYTTVLTILTRLWRKGRLHRERDGRAYAYQPVESRDAYVAGRMQELLAAAGDRGAALTRFIDELDAAERAQLRRMLGRRRR